MPMRLSSPLAVALPMFLSDSIRAASGRWMSLVAIGGRGDVSMEVRHALFDRVREGVKRRFRSSEQSRRVASEATTSRNAGASASTTAEAVNTKAQASPAADPSPGGPRVPPVRLPGGAGGDADCLGDLQRGGGKAFLAAARFAQRKQGATRVGQAHAQAGDGPGHDRQRDRNTR